MNKKDIVIATGNKGKLKEFNSILSPYFKKVYSIADYDNIPRIAETGNTFHDNAFIKAKTVSDHLGVDTVADDSGLLVDALEGAPGVRSARYAGPDASDEENIEKLLSELGNEENRSAKFVCAIVYYRVGKDAMLFTGECHGTITKEKKGNGGFGYDPVFFLEDYGKTMAEIPPEIKNRISHRAGALSKFVNYIINS